MSLTYLRTYVLTYSKFTFLPQSWTEFNVLLLNGIILTILNQSINQSIMIFSMAQIVNYY